MKTFVLAIFTVLSVVSFANCLQCATPQADVPKGWIDIEDVCVKEVRRQIQDEIKASTQYMAMGAHFSQVSINRAGFAKLFFEASKEERDHAMKLVEYLLMRGQLTDLHELIKIEPLSEENQSWSSGVDALRAALKLETYVTKQIKKVIKVCQGKIVENGVESDSGKEDFHLVDYLSGEFLEEQYKGQRDLAGKISTLDKMMQTNSKIGEFLFDKTLLE